MDVSIIIVNYNTCKMTCECIDSIVEKTHGISYEIILVDNASTDGSKEFFEKDQRITYIYSEHNGGFGYGNNLGMKVAKGKHFFLLNSDTLLINNAVKEFFDYAEAHEEKRVYGCYLMGRNDCESMSYFSFPSFTVKDFLKRKFGREKDVRCSKQIKEVDVITGADMFIPRKVVVDVGGFDENFFLNGEECEWQYRMHKKDIKRVILTTPQIIHLGGVSQKAAGIDYHLSKGHFITLKLHMSIPTYYLARFYYFLAYGVRVLRHPMNKYSWDFLKLSLSSINLRPELSKPIDLKMIMD